MQLLLATLINEKPTSIEQRLSKIDDQRLGLLLVPRN